jgi:hypothetical protein
MRKSLLIFLVTGFFVSTSPATNSSVDEISPAAPSLATKSVVTNMHLTEAQKAQIRAEEIYRSQIQQELAAKAEESKSGMSQIWTALNSSFVLWLLSSVVLSGLAAGYTAWQNRHAKIKANNELIAKLDTEISNRIYTALSGTRTYEGSIKNNILYPTKDYYSFMYYFLDNHFNSAGSETHSDFSIFPEFAGCSFRSLITMLYDALQPHGTNKEEVSEFKETLATYESFANLASIQTDAESLSQEDTLRALLQIREIINARILIKRWRKEDLY